MEGYTVIIFILPTLIHVAEVTYDKDKNIMWVYANYPPNRYIWRCDKTSSNEEKVYLYACLERNEWLRDFNIPFKQ